MGNIKSLELPTRDDTCLRLEDGKIYRVSKDSEDSILFCGYKSCIRINKDGDISTSQKSYYEADCTNIEEITNKVSIKVEE